MQSLGKVLYVGHYRHNFDDKGRITIPSQWRTAHTEEEDFLAIPNPAGCITILPPNEVAKLYEKISQVPAHDMEAQEQIHQYIARVERLNYDKSGRFALGKDLLDHAGIVDKAAVLAGAVTKFSIFSPSRWDEMGRKPNANNPLGFMRQYGI